MENNQETPIEENAAKAKEPEMPMWFIIFMFIFTIVSVVYCITHRTWEDFLKYVPYISFGLLVVLLVVVIIGFFRKGINRKDAKDMVFVFPLIILMLILVGITHYSMFVVIKDVFLWFKSPSISRNSSMVLIPLGALTIGTGLFYFRLYMRSIYGLTEAMVGIVVAGNRALTQMDQFTSSEFYLAILTASVYLIVRGFDNIHQGLTKDPIDKYGTKLFTFLKMRI